ncbi:MAG: Maf family protein [Candidatus Nanopelagicales bacterium]
MPTLVLASASPARNRLLTDAGITPVIRVSDVDERAIELAMPSASPAELCLELARAKARAVAAEFAGDLESIVIGCDSVLDVDGTAFGKPEDAATAKDRWQQMSGRAGILRTGHWVIRGTDEVGEVASTTVVHGVLTEAEIDAYIATGEPLQVAGGFTLDGLGAPFVERIDGDPSNVIGLSLPLLRTLLTRLGVSWPSLW